MVAWVTRYGTGVTTVNQAAFDAKGDPKDAMLAVTGERGEADGRRLGRWITKHEGRIDGGLRFVMGDDMRSGL